jgi:ankyrin repeat protein
LKGHDVENDVNKIDELLCTVASYGDIAMTIQFLDQGSNANAKCSYGISPLEASILGKHKELSDALIKYGAEVISEAELAIRSFHSSAINGDSLSIALALKNTPEIRERLDNKIIQEVAQNGHKDVVKLLLSGLDVFCAQTKDIYFAEVCGQEGLIELC